MKLHLTRMLPNSMGTLLFNGMKSVDIQIDLGYCSILHTTHCYILAKFYVYI